MKKPTGPARGDNRPLGPKPYGFVPLPGQVKRSPGTAGHERFVLAGERYSGRLSYRLAARSHVFVSSGQYALADELGYEGQQVVRSCYRVTADGWLTPAIPGASLKGATRAIVEAVTASCIGVTRVERAGLPSPDAARLCNPEALCPACALFGTMSRLARLSFGDALLVEGGTVLYALPPLYRPRTGQAQQTYQERGKYRGRKFYQHGRLARHRGAPVEVIAEGGRLAGSLDFESLTGPEVGLVCFALGLDGTLRPMLGGGKPVCLGSVEVQAERLELVTAADFTEYESPGRVIGGDDLTAFVGQRLREADESGLILPQQREALRRLLNPNNPRPAPTGMY